MFRAESSNCLGLSMGTQMKRASRSACTNIFKRKSQTQQQNIGNIAQHSIVQFCHGFNACRMRKCIRKALDGYPMRVEGH